MITLDANRCNNCQQVVDNSQGALGAAGKGKGKAVEGQQGNENEDDDEELRLNVGPDHLTNQPGPPRRLTRRLTIRRYRYPRRESGTDLDHIVQH